MPQTWGALQTYPLGTISVQYGDIVGLPTWANVDTTNASNITSGTLPAARLPTPTASTLGGVQSAAAVAHKFINSISTAGVPTLAQPDAADVTFTQTGGTQRVIDSKLKDFYSVKDFGAVGDGITDDAPAFRAAIAAIPNGSTLWLPYASGGYLMNSVVNNAVLEIPGGKSISIRGQGWHVQYTGSAVWTATGSVVRLGSNILGTHDFIHVTVPSTGTVGAVGGMEVRDFCITTTSNIYAGAQGRHAIFFDTLNNDSAFFENVLIDNLFIDNMFGGYSITAQANATSTVGGMLLSTISRCFLMSIRLVNTADAITIHQNTFGQNAINDVRNLGVYIMSVSGATTNRVSDNYFLNFNGMIVVDSCPGIIIENNVLEQSFTNTRGSMVDINGGNATVTGANIRGNRFSNVTSTGIIPLRINNATNTNVHGNWFFSALVYPFITITNLATSTFIDGGNYYQDSTGYKLNGNILDSGSVTRYDTPVYQQRAATNVPGIPATGILYSWYDATDGRFHDINSSSVIGTTVVSSTAPAHKFATGVAANGVVNYTQPAITDVSGIGQLTFSLSADIVLSNTASYFDGPFVAQGTSGTWFVTGTVTILGTASDVIHAKLWDGTTVIASGETTIPPNTVTSISLSGIITTPAANIRISVQNPSTAGGKMLFNVSGGGKDCTLTAFRIG
ncbi:hypothetical protein DXU06_20415 [Bradyrhizobium elkanii]